MPWVGLEPTILASERAKTVHALDRSATVTGKTPIQDLKWYLSEQKRKRVYELRHWA
jgi:hypothetical protein